MEVNACLEFPSDCQNITFNLLFVFRGDMFSENLESFHPSYKGSK